MAHRLSIGVLLSSFLLLLARGTTSAQSPYWTQTNGPVGGEIRSAVFAPNGDLYVCPSLGVHVLRAGADSMEMLGWKGASFRGFVDGSGAIYMAAEAYLYSQRNRFNSSTDTGRTWETHTFAPNDAVSSVVRTRSGVLVAMALPYAFRSTTGGASWSTPTMEYLEQGNLVEAFDESLILGCEDGIYRSTDDGATWTRLFYRRVRYVRRDGERVIALTDSAIVASSDGQRWQEIGRRPPGTGAYILIGDADQEFILAPRSIPVDRPITAVRTTDGGATWRDLVLPVGGTPGLIRDPAGHLVLIGRESGKIWTSPDDGATWEPRRAPFIGTDVRRMSACADGTVLAADDRTTWISLDTGSTWRELPERRRFVAVATSGELFIGSDTTVLRSSDKGATWQRIPLPTSDSLSMLAATPDGAVFAATMSAGTVRLNRLQRAPLRWEEIGMFHDSEPWITVVSSGPDGTVRTMYQNALHPTPAKFLQQEALHVTTDGGAHWTRPWTADDGWATTGLHLFNGVVYMARSGLYASTDNGVSWAAIDAAAQGPEGTPRLLAIDSLGAIYVVRDYGVHASLDTGRTWIPFNDGLPRSGASTIEAGPAGVLLMNSQCGGIYRAMSARLHPWVLHATQLNIVVDLRRDSTNVGVLDLHNPGDVPARIDSARVTGARFAVVDVAAGIAPHGHSALRIRYTTDTTDRYYGTVSIWHDGGTVPDVVAMAGEGYYGADVPHAVDAGRASSIRFEAITPSPWSTACTVRFVTPTTRTRLGLFDITGRLVLTLLDADMEAGAHSVVLSRTRPDGTAIAPGVYLLELLAEHGRATAQTVVVQ